MLRTGVFLLAMLQQFMPPGMCLCQALLARKAVPTHTNADTNVAGGEAGHCGCRGCLEHRLAPHATDRPTPEAPSEHPCCPVLFADSQQAVLSADALVDVEAILPVFTPAEAAPSPPRPAHPSPVASQPLASPPLYVSQCALLI